MPSAKPDKTRMKQVVGSRYGWERPENLLDAFHQSAIKAISGGVITPEKAKQLLWEIGLNPNLDFFPYNVLRDLLTYATQHEGWASDLEHDLLVLLSGLTQEYPDIRSIIAEPLTTTGDLYESLFDTAPRPLNLEGKLCDFTGPFQGRSRRELYEQIQSVGGVPSDGGWYTDYFFVAEDHVQQRAISSGMEQAIGGRARYGITRIFKESDFPLPVTPKG